MRIVYCGSGEFGIPTLRALCRGHEVAAVLTQPPRRAGRGGKVRPTPAATAAEALGLAVEAVEDINAPAAVAAIAALSADAMVVADFGQMIRAAAREAARLGAINLHGSLLPELRGAAPVNWAIIRGQAGTGVTVFRLVDRMDAGPVFATRRTDIAPDETADVLRERLAELGSEAVGEALEMLAAGAEPTAQDDSKATAAPRLKKSDGLIDFSAGAAAIRNLIHGTWPWPGARATYVPAEGKPMEVQIARAAAVEGVGAPGQPGEILGDLTVTTGCGRLEIVQIKPAGRRLMPWRDFANGYRAGPGAKFTAADG